MDKAMDILPHKEHGMSPAEFGTEAEGVKIPTCAEFTSYALCISPYKPWLLLILTFDRHDRSFGSSRHLGASNRYRRMRAVRATLFPTHPAALWS